VGAFVAKNKWNEKKIANPAPRPQGGLSGCGANEIGG